MAFEVCFSNPPIMCKAYQRVSYVSEQNHTDRIILSQDTYILLFATITVVIGKLTATACRAQTRSLAKTNSKLGQ